MKEREEVQTWQEIEDRSLEGWTKSLTLKSNNVVLWIFKESLILVFLSIPKLENRQVLVISKIIKN
jgi:hypothetical protein